MANQPYTIPNLVNVSPSRVVTQVAHGFAVGTWLRLTASGFIAAKADSLVNADCIGVVGNRTTTDTFLFVPAGGYVTGMSGLSKGENYYLSSTTAGAMTATPDTTTPGCVVKPLFVADSSTSGFVTLGDGYQVPAIGGNALQTVIPVTSTTYTPAGSDNTSLLRIDTATTCRLTLNNTPGVGTWFRVKQQGVGSVVALPVSGVSLQHPDTYNSPRAQYSIVQFDKTASSEWTMTGDAKLFPVPNYSKCLRLDGTTNSKADATDTGLPSGSATRTIGGWFRVDAADTGSNAQVIYFYGSTSTSPYGRGWLLYEGGSGAVGTVNAAVRVDNYGGGPATAAAVFTSLTWVFLVVTFAAGVVKVYVNGILVSTSGSFSYTTNTLLTGLFRLGQDGFGSSRQTGHQSDVRVYSAELTQPQITTWMTGGEPLSGSLVRKYTLDNVATDAAGSGYSLTLGSGASFVTTP